MTETNQQLVATVEGRANSSRNTFKDGAPSAVAAQQAQRAAALAAQQRASNRSNLKNCQRNVINNLLIFDAAKQQWALVNNKTDEAVPTALDLLPSKGGVFPVWPQWADYMINAVSVFPSFARLPPP